MRPYKWKTATAFFAATAVLVLSALSNEASAATAVIQQCINPQTGGIWNTEFCRCLGLARHRGTNDWFIAGTSDPQCPASDPKVGIGPPSGGIPDDGINNGANDVGWPGWGGNQVAGAPGDGVGDQKHNHTGPPSESPGMSVAGPPGLRD